MNVQSASIFSLSIEQQWQALTGQAQSAPKSAAAFDASGLNGVDEASSAGAASTVQRGVAGSASGLVDNLTGTFAEEMTKALSAYKDPQGNSQDPTALVQSLTQAVESIRDIAGDGAASAAMGALLKKAKSGNLTEDSLRDGMLEAMSFVDQNAGVDAGDKVMAVFNGQVNDDMNAFFNNGSDEHFAVILKDSSGEAVFDSARDAAKALYGFAKSTMSSEDLDQLPSPDGNLDEFFSKFPGQTVAQYLDSLREKALAGESGQDGTGQAGETQAADQAGTVQEVLYSSVTVSFTLERLTLFSDSGQPSGQTQGQSQGQSQAVAGQDLAQSPYGQTGASSGSGMTGLALNLPV
jgi:hypothetical protein